MNKIISIAIVIFAFLQTSNTIAQDEGSFQKIRFGFKLSPAISWMKPDFLNVPSDVKISRDGIKAGFSYGVHLEFALTENLFFQTGLDIQSHKVAYSATDNLRKITESYSMRFVEIPLIFKARTKEIGYLRYFGQFGFGLSSRYRVKLERSEELAGNTLITPFDRANDRVNFFRTSLIFGGGVEYSLSGTTVLILGLTFNDGFTNVLKKQSTTLYDERGLTRYLQLNIGILF